jgi:hypothetical protein
MGDELPAGGMFHRGGNAHLDPELVRPVRFALANALDLGCVQSAFVNRSRKGWVFQPVERFDEQELIDAAAQVYMEIADHNQTMGKNKAC